MCSCEDLLAVSVDAALTQKLRYQTLLAEKEACEAKKLSFECLCLFQIDCGIGLCARFDLCWIVFVFSSGS